MATRTLPAWGDMTISVRIIEPDLVETTYTPSWWERLLGEETFVLFVEFTAPLGWCWMGTILEPADFVLNAISRAFASDAIRRAAETARNYQAAAQRGEYPIR